MSSYEMRYGPLIDSLLLPEQLPELGPGRANEDRRAELSALTIESAFAGQTIHDTDAARCCLSGLWLRHNFLDESHAISQEIETPSGSYWHGIMHRREPDYANSKYWFRRVGEHAIFPKLSQAAKALGEKFGAEDVVARELIDGDAWDPFRFVDWCEQIARGRARQNELAQRIAEEEWRLLFDECYCQALLPHIGTLAR
jgi:hypothetical protein